MKISDSTAKLYFKNVGGGLVTNGPSGELGGFEVAGIDGKFYAAQARIIGKNVLVNCALGLEPIAVRFGWVGDAPANNLFNKYGFPASPFRTDDWNTITKTSKYTIEGLK